MHKFITADITIINQLRFYVLHPKMSLTLGNRMIDKSDWYHSTVDYQNCHPVFAIRVVHGSGRATGRVGLRF
jgi:hypothetical protein